jgi:hypothetical protein
VVLKFKDELFKSIVDEKALASGFGQDLSDRKKRILAKEHGISNMVHKDLPSSIKRSYSSQSRFYR